MDHVKDLQQQLAKQAEDEEDYPGQRDDVRAGEDYGFKFHNVY